ncbi:restriction endonuclease subunit S [Thalassotalea ganghwensis]
MAQQKILKLPKGWVDTPLDAIAKWGAGGTPKRSESSYYGGDIPWVKTGDLGPRRLKEASEYITELGVKNSSAKLFSKGSVAIAMYGATIGKTSILDFDATTNQACAVGQPIDDVTDTEFLYYLLKNEKQNFIDKGKGGAQPNISQQIIKAHTIGFPPLPEQKRIVEKLDGLLAQVDTIQQRLNSLPEIIKRFRQSVLSAAVSGKLTEQWRGENKMLLSPLKDIAKKREELIKSGAIKLSKQNIPLPFDEPLSELPEGWGWARLISISLLVTDGKHGNCVDEANSGYYFLSAKDVKNGKLHYLNAREINQKEFQEVHQRTNLEAGDICIVNTGATVGKLAIAQESPLTEKSTFQKSVAVIKLIKPYMNEKYMSFYLRDASERLLKSSTGSAVNNLLLSTMKQMAVPVPPVEEQTEIVRLVEQYFALADTLEKHLANAKGRVDNLTQAILAKAFRGELVPQDPNDEPADKLLERIKTAREQAQKLEKAAKASERKAAKTKKK